MAFDLGAWLHRRNVESRFIGASTRVQAVRMANPYHSVAIKPCARPCPAALALKGRRFLSAEAPRLPLSDCNEQSCGCVYQHHEDRRSSHDRRLVQKGGLYAERRSNPGRRSSDR